MEIYIENFKIPVLKTIGYFFLTIVIGTLLIFIKPYILKNPYTGFVPIGFLYATVSGLFLSLIVCWMFFITFLFGVEYDSLSKQN